MVFGASDIALAAALSFFLTFLYIAYKISKSEGFNDFSVGISYLDTYSFILAIVPLTAAASYLMMGLGFGFGEFNAIQVPWLRYFEWMISTPILVMGVVFLSQSRNLTIKMMALDFIMILTGFFGVVTTGLVKYSFATISTAIFLWMAYLMMTKVTEKASKRPEPIFKLFKELRNIIIGLWFIYPIFWIISTEGIGLLSTHHSFIGYTLLDVVSKLVYAVVIVRSIERIKH